MISFIPWDTLALGMNCYEMNSYSEDDLKGICDTPGHYTVRVSPTAPKDILQKYDFYYCDTLVVPYCRADKLCSFYDEKVSLVYDFDLDILLGMTKSAFLHGRFHRDFHIHFDRAEDRYLNYVKELKANGNVIGIVYSGEPIGFVAVKSSCLTLHAILPKFRGKGLAKFLWTPVCEKLIGEGHDEITSSISVSNLPILNLYSSLGFSFRNAVDIYHKVII